jgi:hypothetical protein
LRSSSIYKINWGRLPFTKKIMVIFHFQNKLRSSSKYHFIRHLLSKHSLDWVICKLCGKVSMGLIFTLGTGIFNTFMFRLFVSLKKSLCSCLIFTLVTWTFNTFMFRLLVSLKLVLSCCLIFTLVTWIFNTFMFGLLVSFNIAL